MAILFLYTNHFHALRNQIDNEYDSSTAHGKIEAVQNEWTRNYRLRLGLISE
jgi:hypothetical protein